MTVTLEETTVLKHAAPLTARLVGCASMGSVCAKSPSLGKTAQLEGVSMIALTRGCVSMDHASAGLGMWERTAHWSTVPTIAAGRDSAGRGSVSAMKDLLAMTATLVGYYCSSLTSVWSSDSYQVPYLLYNLFLCIQGICPISDRTFPCACSDARQMSCTTRL